jgi:hypothetical protein
MQIKMKPLFIYHHLHQIFQDYNLLHVVFLCVCVMCVGFSACFDAISPRFDGFGP